MLRSIFLFLSIVNGLPFALSYYKSSDILFYLNCLAVSPVEVVLYYIESTQVRHNTTPLNDHFQGTLFLMSLPLVFIYVFPYLLRRLSNAIRIIEGILTFLHYMWTIVNNILVVKIARVNLGQTRLPPPPPSVEKKIWYRLLSLSG